MVSGAISALARRYWAIMGVVDLSLITGREVKQTALPLNSPKRVPAGKTRSMGLQPEEKACYLQRIVGEGAIL